MIASNIAYLAGRIFQLIGLIALPSAIWMGEFGHNEAGSIGILLGSLLVFFLGVLFIRFSKR